MLVDFRVLTLRNGPFPLASDGREQRLLSGRTNRDLE
jgi:hypothetical protein